MIDLAAYLTFADSQSPQNSQDSTKSSIPTQDLWDQLNDADKDELGWDREDSYEVVKVAYPKLGIHCLGEGPVVEEDNNNI